MAHEATVAMTELEGQRQCLPRGWSPMGLATHLRSSRGQEHWNTAFQEERELQDTEEGWPRVALRSLEITKRETQGDSSKDTNPICSYSSFQKHRDMNVSPDESFTSWDCEVCCKLILDFFVFLSISSKWG